MGMGDGKYSVFLDFLTDFKFDKSKIDKYTKDVVNNMKKIKPEIEIDETQVKKSISDIMANIENISKAAKDVNLNMNSDDAKKALKELDDLMKGLGGDIDLNALNKAFDNLPLGDLEKLRNMLVDTVDNFDDIKFGQEVERLAQDYAKAAAEAQEFYVKQKLALAAMEQAGKKGTAEYKKLEEELKKTKAQAEEYEKTMESINKVGIKIDNFDSLMARFEAVGQLGEQLTAFSEKGTEMRDALKDVAAQTGATSEEMDQLKSSAENAFKAGVGESVADAIKTIGTAKQILGDTFDPQELEDFTKSAAAIGQVFDKDVNEVISGSRTFIKQFELDGKNAADLVGYAMQQSGSKMDDTLDTLDEYSQLVKKAGYDATEFVGVLTTGMQMGTRDTDKLADAIKETQIRLNAGDTSKALQGISGPVSKTIQEIVKLGEQGKLSVKQVLQQSTEAMQKSFDAGEITASVRDQLAVALSGTMAEDIGGDLYSKIFSAPLDKEAIMQRATEAGEQINNAIGPVTWSEKLQKDIELLGTKASGIVAPVASNIGNLLTQVSQVAPGLKLFMDYGGKIKDIALGILSKLIPALVVQTGATGAATSAQLGLNTAMLANPAGIIIASIVAVSAAAYGLYSILHKTTEEKLKDTEASIELNKKNQETTQQAIKQEQANTKLIAKYELLTKAKKEGKQVDQELRQVREELNKQYPTTIDFTKSHDDNLKALKEHTGLLNVDTAKFTETNQKLVKEYEKLATQATRTKEEEDRLRVVKQQLKKEFPGFIEGAGGVTESLKYLKEQSGMVTNNMGKLQEQLKGFQKEAKELAIIQSKQKLELTRENALSELSGFVGVAWSDATKEAKNIIVGFYNSITRTADPEKLESLIDAYKQKLKDLKNIGAENNRGSKIDEQEFNSATSAIITMYQQRITELELYRKKEDEIINGTGVTGDTNTTNTTSGTTDTTKAEDAYELSKKKYDQEKKNNEIALASFKTSQQQRILDEQRKRDAEDDLLLSDTRLKGLEKQKVKLIELFQISEDETGKINIGMKLKDDQANDIKTEFYNVREEIQGELGKKNELLLNVDINQNDIDLALENLKIRDSQTKIELGIDVAESEAEIKSILKQRLEKYMSEIDNNNNKIKNLEQQLAGETSDIRKQGLKQEIKELNKANIDKENLVRDANDNIRQFEQASYDKRLADIQEFLEDRKNAIDKRYEDEKSKLDRFQELFGAASDRAIEKTSSSFNETLDDEQAARLKTLDTYKELELISEKQYQERKEAIEEEFRQKRAKREEEEKNARMARETLFQGQQIELQRQKDKESLGLEVDKLKKEKNLLEEKAIAFDANGKAVFASQNDQEAYDKLSTRLKDATDLLEIKGEKINVAWSTIGAASEEGIANAFNGDWEGAADSLKQGLGKILAVMVEGLNKEIDAQILKLFLSWFNAEEAQALPFFVRLALMPAMYALTKGALTKLTEPIMNGLMSFSTGGRIDGPTMAVIGDASKLGSANREWIFNDPQLISLMKSISGGSSSLMAERLARIEYLLASQKLEAKIAGRDINVALTRTQYAESQRSVKV